MLGTAHSIHRFKNSRLSKTASRLFEKFAYLSTMDDGINKSHPLAFVASGQGTNPNMLNHDQAMKVVHKDELTKYMKLLRRKMSDQDTLC